MPATLAFYFTGSDHYLYRSAGGRLELEAKFPADDLGLTDFREYLKGRRGALVYVVADLVGEDFHEDQIPYLRGSARRVARYCASRIVSARTNAARASGTISIVRSSRAKRSLPSST